jgi:hypothetical protein
MAGKQAKILSDANIDDLLLFAETTRQPVRNKVMVLLSAKAVENSHKAPPVLQGTRKCRLSSRKIACEQVFLTRGPRNDSTQRKGGPEMTARYEKGTETAHQDPLLV